MCTFHGDCIEIDVISLFLKIEKKTHTQQQQQQKNNNSEMEFFFILLCNFV